MNLAMLGRRVLQVITSGVVLKVKVGVRCSSVDQAPRSSAVGARIEAPKGVGCGEGVSPYLRGGLCRIFFAFVSNGEFWCILRCIFTAELLVCRLRKTEELGCFN